jgi:hypothetical protein
MLTETELLKYLDETEGWSVGHTRKDAVGVTMTAARNKEVGVYLTWIACDGSQQLPDARHDSSHGHVVFGQIRNRPSLATCCVRGMVKYTDDASPHIHLQIRVRTKAGGFSSGYFTVPASLSAVTNARGAPYKNNRITKSSLPKPFHFCQEKWVRTLTPANCLSGFERMTMMSSCTLIGPVGITSNAKVDSSVAQMPDEDVWFHFACQSPSTATFNIITDGETFYPVNRQSHRISTNLSPKNSVDLTKLGVLDQEMLVEAIKDYVKRL